MKNDGLENNNDIFLAHYNLRGNVVELEDAPGGGKWLTIEIKDDVAQIREAKNFRDKKFFDACWGNKKLYQCIIRDFSIKQTSMGTHFFVTIGCRKYETNDKVFEYSCPKKAV